MKTLTSFLFTLSLLVLVFGTAGCDFLPGGGTDKDETVFVQQDRLGRPVVNEVLATWANSRHEINNSIVPTQDDQELKGDIINFMKVTAGRSDAHANTLAAVLVPDVLLVDLSQSGPATYLGVETGGATGGTFGGRALTDDVVDISLGAIFGTTLSDLGLVDPDGNEIPALTTDNVGTENNNSDTFPYLVAP